MIKHLPFPVKQLLTLRNPNSLPSPLRSKLHAVFATTLGDAKEKKAENGWLVLTTCVLLTVNRPSAVGHLYRFATRSDPDKVDSRSCLAEAAKTAALMRESALKSVIFVGVPRTILSLDALTQVFEDDVKMILRKTSQRLGTPDNIESITMRGRALWNSVYEPHADKLHDKLGFLHPDFISFIIQSYGSILAPLPAGMDQQGNLSRALSSVVGVACLRAEGGVGPQLTSHVFGLMKARYVENQNEEDKWLSSDEGTGWVIRTVDHILDAVTSESDTGEVKAKL